VKNTEPKSAMNAGKNFPYLSLGFLPVEGPASQSAKNARRREEKCGTKKTLICLTAHGERRKLFRSNEEEREDCS